MSVSPLFWHSYCLVSCVPNWRWGGAVCRAMLTRDTAVAIYGHGLGQIFLAFFYSDSLPTCHLRNWNFNRQFGRRVSKDTNDMTRLPPYARTQMCHPACVSQCVGISTVFGEHRRLCVWVEMHNMPSYFRTFWWPLCMWSCLICHVISDSSFSYCFR